MRSGDPRDWRQGRWAWLRRLRRPGQAESAGRYVARPARGAYDSAQRRAGTYGRQARPQPSYGPYALGFIFIIFALLAFLYVGLDWATGAGRLAGLGIGARPTPSLAPAIASPSPSPLASPSVVPSPAPQRTYVVQAGDNPGSIAAQFNVSVSALLELNNVDDPTKLQVGQVLRIPN